MISFSWSVEHAADGSYVHEFEDGVMRISYGPMPATAVGPFIDECKENLADTFARLTRRSTNG